VWQARPPYNRLYVISFRRAEVLPVLRGFSRNVKQDSEASNESGEESEANVASGFLRIPPRGGHPCL
jgi:hypothetical protein